MLGNQLKKPAHVREIGLTSVGLLIFVYMAISNFLMPIKDQANGIREEIKQVRSEADAIAKFNEVIRQNQKQQIGTTSQPNITAVKDLRVQLIQRNKKARYRNITDFLEEITSPMFRSSVNIDSLKYDQTAEMSGYSATKFEIVLNGRFPRVLHFIKKLEGIEALLTLENIEVMTNKTDTFSVTVKLGGTYYQIENEQA